MKALDTNVLVRFLVRDDEQQAKAVYRKFKQAEAKKEVFFIPVLVVLETVWVLESVYEITRQEILVPCLINCVRDFGNLSFQIDDAVRQPRLKVQYD
jgi:predicted nucleic-acid-binding protein